MNAHLPTQHLLAMIRSTNPRQAAGVLLSTTPDRRRALLDAMSPVTLARIVVASPPAQRRQLLAVLPDRALPPVLRELSLPEVALLVAETSPAAGAELMLLGPPPWTSAVLGVLDPATRQRVEPLLPPELLTRSRTADHLQRFLGSIAGTSATVAWLDERSGDVLVAVFGNQVHVAVRHRDRPLTDADVDVAARSVGWTRVIGLVVVTNLEVTAAAIARAREIERHGRPVDVVQWAGTEHDGALKRALVRLASMG